MMRLAWSQRDSTTDSMTATVIDGMDTLKLMGLDKEFEEGRNWIANDFNMDSTVRIQCEWIMEHKYSWTTYLSGPIHSYKNVCDQTVC